ncbi:MAG TPA: hypothetical protein VFQ53_07425 [Kofleriaceae bacterium]|nr:hypothetical protein [Kofleriaceae bacterium]
MKVLGIMNLVFAGLGAIGTLFSYAMYWGGMKLAMQRNPVVEAAHANPSFMAYLKISLVLGLVGSVALLAIGIGMLKLRAWARKAAIWYSIYAIVAAIVGVVVTWVMLVRPMLDHAQNGIERASATGGAFGGIAGGLFGVAYPIVLLLFMMRKNVVAAFERANEPPLPPARVL